MPADMLRVRPDKDRLLDSCASCDSRAGFRIYRNGARAECTNCPAGTDLKPDKSAAMVDWNIAQRKLRQLHKEKK